MNDFQRTLFSGAVSTASLALAVFTFLRWYRYRTNRRLASVFLCLAIAVSAGWTAFSSFAMGSPSRDFSDLWFRFLFPFNIVLLGVAVYFLWKSDANSTA